jgi:hypothetical protein
VGVSALAINALATWRLTRLFGVDKITEGTRDRITETALRYGVGVKALYLLDCPYCLSIYAAGVVILLNRLPLGKTVVRLLAMSAVGGELSNRLDLWTE